MSDKRVAKVTDLIAASTVSFDEAIKVAHERASETLRNITGMRIKEQRVAIAGDQIVEYRVRVEVIFILDM